MKRALVNVLGKHLLALSVAATLSYSVSSQAAEQWDMALAYPASSYQTQMAESFAREVGEKTAGQLAIATHPNGSLFGGGEIFSAVRRGLAPIGERIISALGNEDPLFEVDALPFVASSFDASWKLYQASKPRLEEVLDKKGLKLLYCIPWPPQGLYMKKPISSIDDMKGVRFRTYNPMTNKLAAMMGAAPTQVEVAEVAQAFATGVADSMLSSAATGIDTKLWEYVGYWYDVKAWLPKNMVFVNKKVWDKLPADTQATVLQAAADTEKAGWDKARQLTAQYQQELQTNGMQVVAPSPELEQGFEHIGKELLDDWLKRSGPEGQAVIDAYQKM